jgi:RNA polymerase sigma-70 factor (ECF subfamily)
MQADASLVGWPAPSPSAAMSDRDASGPAVDESAADVDLVAAAAAGSSAAFDVLVTRHRRTVYQVCYRFVNHHEDAADLTQDTFVRAWRALPSFRGQARFSTWLHRIAVNVCLNKRALRTPVGEALDAEALEDDRQPHPGDALDAADRAAAVRAAVAALPPRQRAVLILRTYHDLSHQEVADLVGSSVGAVKANVFHALANLRRRLGARR